MLKGPALLAIGYVLQYRGALRSLGSGACDTRWMQAIGLLHDPSARFTQFLYFAKVRIFSICNSTKKLVT